MKDYSEILKELNSLPRGYVSEKTIKNKRYFYLQYKENGKLISKYIKKSELEDIQLALSYREILLDQLREYELEERNLIAPSKRAKEFTGYLMMGDKVVARFSNDSLDYMDERLAPLIIVRTKRLSTFLKGRVIDSSRTNSRLLKRVLNIHTDKDEEIALYANGACITDNYWFKPSGSKLKYSDINFNSDFYSDLALKGEITFISKTSKRTPQLTATGSFEKCWKKINKKWWMYKAGNKKQIFSELLCSNLAYEIGLPTAKYEYDDGYICTKNFADKYNFEPMSSIASDDDSYEYVFNKLNEIDDDLAKQYIKLVYFDAVVFNVDRHNENCGLLRSKVTGEIISLAPNFDNNLALISTTQVLNLDYSKEGFMKLFIKFINSNEIAKRYFKSIDSFVINEDVLDKCIEKIPFEIDYDLNEIKKFIIDRNNYLIHLKTRIN